MPAVKVNNFMTDDAPIRVRCEKLLHHKFHHAADYV